LALRIGPRGPSFDVVAARRDCGSLRTFPAALRKAEGCVSALSLVRRTISSELERTSLDLVVNRWAFKASGVTGNLR